jgi:hypothetical protein
MATVTFQGDLSGQTDGKHIKVVATATAGTTIHTATSSGQDLVDLWAVNSSTSAVKLTIEWGEATAPDGNIEVTIPPESGEVQITDRKVIGNSLVVKAFAGSANVILLHGKFWNAA